MRDKSIQRDLHMNVLNVEQSFIDVTDSRNINNVIRHWERNK